jgi:hypothetical protein
MELKGWEKDGLAVGFHEIWGNQTVERSETCRARFGRKNRPLQTVNVKTDDG